MRRQEGARPSEASPGRSRLDAAEQLLEPLRQPVADPAADPDDHPLGPVPGVEVRGERLARRALDRLARSEDVPAEGLVGVEQPVVDVADVALRRVEIDVHLLEDHALLLRDLRLVELRVQEHVGKDVEGGVARLRPAADVVAGQLLPGERVELAADRVDLGRDRPRRRAPLRPLEEHVLGEVRDALRIGRLVARPGREHDEAGHRSDLREGRGDDADTVPKLRLLEDRHGARWYRHVHARTADSKGDRSAAGVARAGARRRRAIGGYRPARASSSPAAARRSMPRSPAGTPRRRSSSSWATRPTPTFSSRSPTREARRSRSRP